METTLNFLKELKITNLQAIFMNALDLKQVTASRMDNLEGIWRKSKNNNSNKRVLFVKDSTNNILQSDRTILKMLPNLPNDDETSNNSSSGNI